MALVMGALIQISNRIVTAFILAVWFSILATLQSVAQTAELDQLFERLKDPETEDWEVIEADIVLQWSRSGSPAMDLLLKRGRDAMEAGDLDLAIEHLTALVDHAPDFAEGWNSRATALFLDGRVGPAVADIQRTLELNPRHFGALTGFALILEDIGRSKEALEVWKAAQALHPHHPGINQSVIRLERQESGRDL